MKQYLLCVYQPDGPTPDPPVLDRIRQDVVALRDEMQRAGVHVFSGGLHAPGTAKVLRPGNGAVLITDGPFAESKEHIGGFSIITAPDLDVALDWGRKLALATTLPIEVRPFHEAPGH